MLNACCLGASCQVIQERLIRINGVDQRAEFLCQDHCLPTCPATCIYNDIKLSLGKKSQDIQGMGIAAWAKLFHTAEK
jgi:hypothetical protein